MHIWFNDKTNLLNDSNHCGLFHIVTWIARKGVVKTIKRETIPMQSMNVYGLCLIGLLALLNNFTPLGHDADYGKVAT